MINKINFSMQCNPNIKVNFGNQQPAKHIQELIEFTTAEQPSFFRLSKITSRLNVIKPTAHDLDALEKSLNNKAKWNPKNKEYFEGKITNLLKNNGRKID